jgi:hypothetical protein
MPWSLTDPERASRSRAQRFDPDPAPTQRALERLVQTSEMEVTMVRTAVDIKFSDVVMAGIVGGIVFARWSPRPC